MTELAVVASDLRVGDVIATIGRRVDAIKLGRKYVTLSLGPSSVDRLGLTVRCRVYNTVTVLR